MTNLELLQMEVVLVELGEVRDGESTPPVCLQLPGMGGQDDWTMTHATTDVCSSLRAREGGADAFSAALPRSCSTNLAA